jgi:indolepyruvate ferredoxin oxidoreductase
MALDSGVEPLLHALAALRRLRGTPLDPFGWSRVRRLERALARWYEAVLERLCAALSAENRDEAAAIAALAREIRGYEAIKEARAERVRPLVERRLEAFGSRR